MMPLPRNFWANAREAAETYDLVCHGTLAVLIGMACLVAAVALLVMVTGRNSDRRQRSRDDAE